MASCEPMPTICCITSTRRVNITSANARQDQSTLIAVNSADDMINPPELGIMEREIKRVKNGRYVLLPITDQTRGHGTHTIASIWQGYLKKLLKNSNQPSER